MEENLIVKDLDVTEIQKYQQNRYPCLFIDYVEEAVAGRSASGYKMFTYNEWFFPDHFEDEPIVPGFVLVEMMTQIFLMTFLVYPEAKGKKTMFSKIDHVEFKEKVKPGQKVDLKAVCDSYRRGIGKGKTEAYIEGRLVCSAEFRIVVPEIMEKYRPAGR